jgi:uncharacterized protein
VSTPTEPLSLLDWKRRVATLYAEVRQNAEPTDAWELWRRTRNELFKTHPQSPLPVPDRDAFEGLPYFAYDPSHRVHADVQETDRHRYEIGTSGDGAYAFERFALAAFDLAGESHSLELYWLEGYGGGLFLPFADATSADETYGAGRYLLDTVKGADLGMDGGRLILDFNFAYNPSCSYDPSWVCPLATPANRLPVAVRAGERYSA